MKFSVKVNILAIYVGLYDLGHLYNFPFPLPKEAPIPFGFHLPRGFRQGDACELFKNITSFVCALAMF